MGVCSFDHCSSLRGLVSRYPMQKATLYPVLVKMCKDVPWYDRPLNNCDGILPMVKLPPTNLATQRRLAVCLKSGLGTLTAIGTLAIGTLTIVAPPAQAGWFTSKPIANPYKLCGTSLEKAGITADTAATACAEVMHPEDLASCVGGITPLKVDALTTLNACRRTRRPVELATCVQDVQRQDANAVLVNVLEACRQSLLPQQYGQCVVGLNQSLKTPIATGLTTCIDASDRPIDIRSNFVPINNLPRLNGFGGTGSSTGAESAGTGTGPSTNTGTGTGTGTGTTPAPSGTTPAPQLY
jgi:hypothetical protein